MKTLLRNVSTIVITLFFTYNLSAQIVSNTFYVRNINDSGTESFRQAIANAAATTATTVYIYFNLPAGSTTITLQSEIVTSYTGFTSKTINIYGANSTGQVIITGTGTRAMNCLRNTSYYYTFNIYSLQFQNFNLAISSAGSTTIGGTGTLGNIFVNNNRGVYLATNSTLIGNYFGTNRSFSTGLGNYVGIELYGGYNNRVSNNYICSNSYGIYAHNLSTYLASIYITNNIIGTNNTSATRTDLGNNLVYYGYNGTESSNPYFWGNTIAYTTGDCLYLDTYSEVEKNDFICNTGRIIYNKSTPYPTPVITAITPTQYGTATISGTSTNLYGQNDSIVLFYRDPNVCSTTPCQGRWLATVAANASKQWTASVSILPGYQITALANGYEYVIGAVEAPPSSNSLTSLLTGCYTIPCPSVAINFTQANNVLCYGGTDGAARLSITPNGYTYFDFNYKVINTATNGTAATGTINPYTSQTQPIVISGLSAGTYNVVISNPYNNCSYTSSSITITQPSAPLSTTTCKEVSAVTTLTSSDGVGQVIVSGGTSPYSLSVQRPSGTVINYPSQTSNIFNITGLTSGTHNVTVYDAGYAKGTPKTGCTATCSFTISTPSCTNLKVAVSQITNPLCYSGFGSLKIKCTDLASNLPFTLSLSNGFSQTINSFSSDSTVTVSNLPAGSYTITLRNRVPCTVVTTATITQPTPVTVFCDTSVVNAQRVGEASGSKNVSLSGGTMPYTLNLTGSETRTITNIYAPYGSYNISNLKAGTYIVKLTDVNGCTSGNCSFVIKDPDCTGFNVTAQTDNIRCFGENNGKITLTTVNVTTPITYLWSTNANTGNQSVAQNLGVGTYSVTTTDDRYCKDTTTASISTPSVLTTNVVKTDVQTVGAADGKATITVSGGTPVYNVSLTLNGTSISPSTQTTTVFTFNGLTKGTYLALTTDTRGCSKWDTIRINDPSCNFQITGKSDSVSCYNGNNGRITITPNSLAYPVSYNWNQTGLSGNIVTNLTIGAYSVTATTSQNCSDTLTVIVYQPDSLAVSVFPNDVTTVGGSNGVIGVTINGGTQPYTVMLGTTAATRLSATSYAFYNLSKGTYSFIITDAKGCTRTQTATIKDPDCSLMSLDKQVDSVKCKGGATGRITLVVNNTVGAVSYLWSPPSVNSGSVANNLVAGTYFATATDSRNCKANISVTVFEPTALTSTSALTHVTTVNGSNGRISVTVNGGTPPYSVRQDTMNATAQSATIFNFNNLKSGTYTYTATDNNGCTTSQTVTITEPICNLAIAKTVTNISCNGQSNGIITNTITGGRLPLTILWSNGATTPSLTNIAAGTYSISVRDSVGCIKNDTTIITQPPVLAVNIASTNITRVGANNGTITLVASGGTPAYALNMTWNNTAISPTSQTPPQYNFTNLGAGTYRFTFTDAKGCTKTDSVTITEPTCRLVLPTPTVVNVSCNGGSTGSITANPTGGSGALTYTWNPTQTGNSNSATGLKAGLYRLTVSDTLGCIRTDSMRVTEPTVLISTPTVTNVGTIGGNNGSINILVRGGTSPYTVVQGTPSVTATRLTDSTFVFNTLTKGTYTYTVTDSKGCTTSQTLTITEPICNLAIAKTKTDVSCNGQANGSITNTITGGRLPLTVLWSNGATTPSLTNIAAGTYSISVRDSVGCIKNDTTIITQPPVLAVNIASTNITRVGANNGTITLVASGGTPTYALNMTLNGAAISPTSQTPPQYNFTNLGAGTYRFTFTDAKGCTKTDSVTITEPTCRLVLPTPTVVNVSCNGGSTGSITANPTGGSGALTYTWNPTQTGNSNSATGLKAGLYRLTVSDTLGCIKTDSMRVTEPAVLISTPTVTNVGTIGGNNGSINILVRGGTSPYTVVQGTPAVTATRLTDSTFVFNTLTKGTYTYTVTDSKGCTASATVTVSDPSCTLEIATTVTHVSCNGQSNGGTCVTTTGGTTPITYRWSNGATTACLTNIPAGAYTVTVTDVLGCIKTATTTVTQPPVLAVNFAVTNITRVGANNGTITLVASGGTPTYALNMTLNGGAISPTSQTPPQYNFTNLTVGKYIFTITDSKGCIKTDSVLITEPTCRLQLSAPTIVNIACNNGSNGSITINSTGGSGALTYTWNPAQTTNTIIASNLKAGLYRVTVSDTLGCIKTDSMRVSEPTALVSTPTVTNVTILNGNDGRINITVHGGTLPYTVTRGTPSVSATRLTDSTFVFNTLTKGTYTYTVTDSKGCTATATVTVNDPICSTFVLTSSVTDVACKGDATGSIIITPTGGTAPYTFVWTPTSLGTTDRASNLRTGIYTVSVTDNIGCSQSKTITVAEPSTVLSATATATATTTTVATDGTITVTVSGGTAPYIVRSGTLIATTQSSTNFIFNNLASNDYVFTVTDSKGCTTSGTVNVGSPNCNLSVETLVTAVKCKGEATGSIVLIPTNAVGNTTIVWTPSTVGTGTSALNLRAGTYTFTVTDSRNCSQSRTITVTEPPALDSRSSKTDVAQIGSSDGRISVVGLGGTPPYSVTIGTTTGTQIRPDSFVFTGLGRGNYTYILKDANGCTVSQTVVINDPSCATATADLTVAQPISCFGASDGRLNLATSNFVTPQYSWNPSSIGNVQNPSGLKAGLYIVTVSDTRGCSVIKQITLTEPLQIKATLLGDTTICQGQSTILRFSVENATNFVITYTEGAQNFTATSLQATVSPAANTTYRLVSINAGTCAGLVSSNTARVNVTIPTGIASIKAQKDSLCEGGTITLVPSPLANQYVWQRPNAVDTVTTDALIIPNANNRHAGNYTVKTRQSGCLSPASPLYKISVFAKPTEKPNAGVDKLECDGTTTTLNATAITSPNATGRWISVNNNVVLTQMANNITTATNLSVGLNTFVWVLSSDFCGEVSRDSVVISVSGKPELDGTPSINLDSKLTTALINTRELLKNKSLDPSVFSFKILNKPDKAIVNVVNNGIYFDRNDLIDGQTIEIEFEICSKICTSQCNKGKIQIVLQTLTDDTDFRVPKVFSLNNTNGSSLNIDGIDLFLDNEITIVNRWGSIVFGPTAYKNDVPDKSWNGTKDGKPLPTGAYYYYIRYKDNAVLKTKRGILYLVEE